MQIRKYILGWTLIMLAHGVWAQERVMSLNDCLIYAQEHAFANRSNRLATEQAKMDKSIHRADASNVLWRRGDSPWMPHT